MYIIDMEYHIYIIDIKPFQDVILILIPERIMASPMAVSIGVMIMGRLQMTIVASTYRMGKIRFTLTRAMLVSKSKTWQN